MTGHQCGSQAKDCCRQEGCSKRETRSGSQGEGEGCCPGLEWLLIDQTKIWQPRRLTRLLPKLEWLLIDQTKIWQPRRRTRLPTGLEWLLIDQTKIWHKEAEKANRAQMDCSMGQENHQVDQVRWTAFKGGALKDLSMYLHWKILLMPLVPWIKCVPSARLSSSKESHQSCAA